MSIERWTWDDDKGPAELKQRLEEQGYALFHMADAPETSRHAQSFVGRLFRSTATRIEEQAIKVVATAAKQGAYPGTSGPARFHIDGPAGSIVPPMMQIMVCRQPAERGGESLILDGWSLLARIAEDEPRLFQELIRRPRLHRWTGRPGGEPVHGPTVSLRRGHLVCLHPATQPLDAVSLRFRERIDGAVPIEFRAEAGDVYVNNNHRTLHARRGFLDPRREFARINTWMTEPAATPSRFVGMVELATQTAAWLRERIATEPRWVADEFALTDPVTPELAHDWSVPNPPPEVRAREMARVLERLSRQIHTG